MDTAVIRDFPAVNFHFISIRFNALSLLDAKLSKERRTVNIRDVCCTTRQLRVCVDEQMVAIRRKSFVTR